MAEEDLETVRRANDAFNRGDHATWASVFAEDVVLEDLNHAPDAAPVVHGRDGVQAIVADWEETFADFRADIEEIFDLGDGHVVCVTRWHGRGRSSAMTVDERNAELWEVRDGRIVRGTLGFATREEALRAAERVRARR